MSEILPTLEENEFPFYDEEPTPARTETSLKTSDIPQGPGSVLDSDTIDGFQAVSASAAGPNKLVATGSDGKLPSAVIPSTTATGWTQISVTTVTSSTSISIDVDADSYYRIQASLVPDSNTAAVWKVRVNGASTNSYLYGMHYVNSAAAAGALGSTGTNAFNLQNSSGTMVASTDPIDIEIGPFRTNVSGRSTRAIIPLRSCAMYSTEGSTFHETGMGYQKVGAITSVQIVPPVASTGTVIVEKLITA